MLRVEKILPVLILLHLFMPATGCTRVQEPVREPSVAGSFYPSDPDLLMKTVSTDIGEAAPCTEPGRLLAIVAPHAGFAYSGPVAGTAYRQLSGRGIRTAIVLGFNHKVAFGGAAVYARGGWRTPLGIARIDEELAASLIDESVQIGFYPGPHEGEHSIETQIPFLQSALGREIRIVPIAIGTPSEATFRTLTEKLAGVLRRRTDVLLVASTDLSHYHDDATARHMDYRLTRALTAMDSAGAEGLLRSGEGEMCGAWPVFFALEAVRLAGATHGSLYRYANSGDATGEKSRVVGYAAIGYYQASFTMEEKRELLDLAKSTIEDIVTSGSVPGDRGEKLGESPKLRTRRGVFVTINREKRLRGCIGSIQPVEPLKDGVVHNAVNAAVRDPRFPPLSRAELTDMEVEVSVLSPLSPIERKDIEKIEIGRDGLYLENGRHGAVFLPQVPVEQGWDRTTYLEELCRKAGLSSGCYDDAATLLKIFTADVIRDGEVTDKR